MSETIPIRPPKTENKPRFVSFAMQDTQLPYSTSHNWFACFPVDIDGNFTTETAFKIVRTLYERRNEYHTAYGLALDANVHPKIAKIILRSLEFVDFVIKDADGNYKYNLNPRHTMVDLQAKCENHFIKNSDQGKIA